ncbi:MAG: hypothetical protein A2942_00875 [Candidatus Lloydbacteria bacterium RIFCSPLOWO2_01_FULL_50_20]|uniref:Fibronectin type-III domain-containing protein n=1 Tax=Candidatus Lloydbacteria bacterium RIFCSPLOWO2_01_FULL_50_20 TaxID=1798665 RepID=A0A1G2DF70_9BACT|nr:MAG: hypothetical protein A2942_00875 [Candidatus Lloydbacteria bacterium RIFCSPLOWO2_01_FULL_50_20]
MSTNDLSKIEASMKKLQPVNLSEAEKAYAWSKISAGVEAPSLKFSYFSLWKRARSKVIAGTLGVLLLGGTAVTAGAHYAMPGDLLFPVEIAKEKTQIFLANDQRKKDQLHIKFSEKRLSQVRELAALAYLNASGAGTTTVAVNTGTSTLSTTTPGTIAKGVLKKIARAEKAMAIALAQLTETRATLVAKGNIDGVLVIDDIINELKGVGDGSVTITRLAVNGNEKNDRVSIRATLAASSTATSTLSGTVRIDEKKNGAKIVLKSDNVKTEITVGGKNNSNNGKKDRDDDEDDDEDEDENDDHSDDKKSGKKVTICHIEGAARQTISGVSAGRAHLMHGDLLGVCSDPTTPPASDTTAPSFLSITTTATTSSTTVRWTTNEHTNGVIYVGQTTPVNTATATGTIVNTFALSHETVLSGLTASTTYRYLVVARDQSGNIATSSEQSFITTSI